MDMKKGDRASNLLFIRNPITLQPTAYKAFISCDPDRARTCDRQIRNLLLYPTELRDPTGCKSNISDAGFQIVSIFACVKTRLMETRKNPLRLEPVIGTFYKLVPARAARRVPENSGEETWREIIASNPAHFEAREALADRLTAEGKVAEACQLRLDGCMLVCDLLDGADEDLMLDWEDPYTAQALGMVYGSAEDHFVIGDFEMATAMLELLADRDPEDHLNAAELLLFCYAALEEWELFDETEAMLQEGMLSAKLAGYWAAFRRAAPQSELLRVRETMRKDDPALYKEWTAAEHEITQEYLADIESRRPSAAAEARRLWLRTESLWRAFPEFIAYLRA